MSNEEYRRYKYRPDLFAYDVYGKTDYDFVILLVNGIKSVVVSTALSLILPKLLIPPLVDIKFPPLIK